MAGSRGAPMDDFGLPDATARQIKAAGISLYFFAPLVE
jgi:hypothetical protein